ncbi:MAG: hypothetical protein NTU41_08655, partial [Chloroflexi bacterium]|nr:hypothetical protein [Chloroflexota bacterium]
PIIQEINKYIDQYHSDTAAAIRLGTGQLNGWFQGMILLDALKRAAAEVGAANVNGQNLFEALKATNMTVDGWDLHWQITTNVHCFLRQVKLVRYSNALSTWVSITGWTVPPSFVAAG